MTFPRASSRFTARSVKVEVEIDKAHSSAAAITTSIIMPSHISIDHVCVRVSETAHFTQGRRKLFFSTTQCNYSEFSVIKNVYLGLDADNEDNINTEKCN